MSLEELSLPIYKSYWVIPGVFRAGEYLARWKMVKPGKNYAVGCFLARQVLASSDAFAKLHELRGDIPGGSELSPETEGQKRMVLEWKKEL
jgi:hypothetical protein